MRWQRNTVWWHHRDSGQGASGFPYQALRPQGKCQHSAKGKEHLSIIRKTSFDPMESLRIPRVHEPHTENRCRGQFTRMPFLWNLGTFTRGTRKSAGEILTRVSQSILWKVSKQGMINIWMSVCTRHYFKEQRGGSLRRMPDQGEEGPGEGREGRERRPG